MLNIPKCRGSPRCSWQRRAPSWCSGWPLSWAPQESSWTALQKIKERERERESCSVTTIILSLKHSHFFLMAWKRQLLSSCLLFHPSLLYSISVIGRGIGSVCEKGGKEGLGERDLGGGINSGCRYSGGQTNPGVTVWRIPLLER